MANGPRPVKGCELELAMSHKELRTLGQSSVWISLSVVVLEVKA